METPDYLSSTSKAVEGKKELRDEMNALNRRSKKGGGKEKALLNQKLRLLYLSYQNGREVK